MFRLSPGNGRLGEDARSIVEEYWEIFIDIKRREAGLKGLKRQGAQLDINCFMDVMVEI